MPDYDVGVLGLSSPPQSSVLTPYRPAVSVRNNGIHDALASGTLRIYAADRLIFTTELYSATIPPGETRDALGTDYWTPPAEGNYLIIADVTCPLDQVETNNHLSPTAITVSGGPPPPPTTVAPHGSQHEDGGADEVNIDGLHGRLADAQPALAHKATHMVGGSDAISVEGLPGQLLEAQGIRDHAQTHEALGTDRINVDGLHGQLYNVQKPDVHDNSAHDPNYSINKHGAVDHNADVEKTANKNIASGYCGLDVAGLVQQQQLGINPNPSYLLSGNQAFLRPREAFPNARRISGVTYGFPIEIFRNSAITILDTTLPAASLGINSAILIHGLLWHRGQPTAKPTIYLDLKENGYAWAIAASSLLCNKTPAIYPAYELIRFRVWIFFYEAGDKLLVPWLEAYTSDEHSNAYGDWATVSQRIFDFANTLQVRLRVSEPDIADAYAQCGPVELSVVNAPVL
jgi:hypothetical protein